MKRSLGLLLLGVVFACETTPDLAGPGTGTETGTGTGTGAAPEPISGVPSGDRSEAPSIAPEIVAPSIAPEIVARVTVKPPTVNRSCNALGRAPESSDDCAALGTLIQAEYATPRPIRYLASAPGGSQLRVADDPYSISRCDAREGAVGGLKEPACVCASAMDDMDPALLGRFGEPRRNDAGPFIDSCGQQLGQGSERWMCLYQADEFPGCDPGVVDSCAGVCADFRARAIAQAASTFDVQVRRARFVPHAGGSCSSGWCQLIFEVGSQCFVDYQKNCKGGPPALRGPGYDCSLSDEEILAQAGYPVVSADAGSSTPQCIAEAQDTGTASSGDAGTDGTSNGGGGANASAIP